MVPFPTILPSESFDRKDFFGSLVFMLERNVLP